MLHFLPAVVIALLLTGCTVYVPLQPIMPLVAEKGQLEATASLQFTGRLETTAAYSPAPHVVLTGAGTLGLWTKGKEYLRTRQGELGAGGYWTLGNQWLLSATGGVGTAHVNRRNCLFGCNELEGQYRKIFGQVGVAYEGWRKTSSFTYRLSNAQYSQVRDGEKLLAKFGTYRHELCLANRRPLGANPEWFWQSTAGVSFSSLNPPSKEYGAPLYKSDRWFAAGIPALLFSFGVGWQPQR
jgi:hypothetical protein